MYVHAQGIAIGERDQSEARRQTTPIVLHKSRPARVFTPPSLDVLARQLPDGSFTGDVWGEVDTRFSYCAVATLSLLGALDRLRARVYPVATDGSVRPTPGGTAQGHVMDGVAATIRFIEACRNFDGGYGSVPGAESHAGQSMFYHGRRLCAIIRLTPSVLLLYHSPDT